jgi:hypothetical protein
MSDLAENGRSARRDAMSEFRQFRTFSQSPCSHPASHCRVKRPKKIEYHLVNQDVLDVCERYGQKVDKRDAGCRRRRTGPRFGNGRTGPGRGLGHEALRRGE